jgi:outer membrane autotransporter protein
LILALCPIIDGREIKESVLNIKYLLLSSFTLLSGVSAQITTWTSPATTGNWSTAGNWDNGAPVNGTGTAVVFPSIAQPPGQGALIIDTFQDIVGLTINSLSFSITDSPTTYTVEAPVGTTLPTLTFDGVNPTISLTTSGTFPTFPLFQDIAGMNVVLNQNLRINDASVVGGLTFNDSIITGSGSLTYNGTTTSSLTLTDVSTFSGGTTITAGVLSVGSQSALGTGNLTMNTGTTLTTFQSFSGNLVNSILLNGNATIDTSTFGINLGGNITASSGSTIVTFAGTSQASFRGTGTLQVPATVNSGATLLGDPALINNAPIFTTDITNNGSVIFEQYAGDTSYANTMTGTGTASVFGTSTLTIASPGSLRVPVIVAGGAKLAGTATTLLRDISVATGATVTFNQTAAGTYSHAISGTGQAIVGGTAPLTISGTLSIPATVNAGASLIGTAATLLSSIVDNGTVTFNQTVDGLYAGTISGSGDVDKTGADTLTISGPNSYSGNTSLMAGTIELSTTAGTLGSGTLFMSAGTTLLASADGVALAGPVNLGSPSTISVTTGTTTLSNSVSGGVLTKTGSGTLNLTGVNSYTGVTNLAAGTIQINSASALGANTLNMSTGTTFVTNADGITLPNTVAGVGSTTFQVNTGTTTLSGDTSGDTFTKTGPGVLTFTNASNVYTGQVTVSTGELAVMGTLTAPTLRVDGTLSGTGTVDGIVNVYGIVDPGASPGNLTVNGNFVFQDSSTFNSQGTPTMLSETIVHGGNISIGDSTTFIFDPDLTMGAYSPNYTFPILAVDAGHTITGKFSRVTSTSTSLGGSLDYTGNEVFFTLLRLLSGYNFRGNPGKVATALDELTAVANNDTIGILTALAAFEPNVIYDALDRLHPALYKGLTLAQENNATLVRSSITQRFLPILDGYDCTSCSDRPFHVWASGIGDLMRQKTTTSFDSPQTGYKDTTWGATLGVDWNFLDLFYVGAIGAYTHANVNWDSNYGKGDVKSGYGGVYASAIGPLFYGNFSLIGAWSAFDAHRNIIYPGVSEVAYNKHSGKQLTSHLDTGLNFSISRLIIRPFDSVDWIVQNEAGFNETGAGIYDLDVDNSRANMVRNELGVDFGSCGYWRKAKFSGDAKVSWVNETRIKGSEFTSVFSNTTVPFTVNGYFPNRNLFACGANITAAIVQELVTCEAYRNGVYDHDYLANSDVLSVTISYNGVFGTKYMDNSIGCQLNFGF